MGNRTGARQKVLKLEEKNDMKTTAVGYILLVALLVACKPLQIKEFELETIPGLKGKVEKMVVTKIGYDSDSLNTDNAEFFRSVNTIFLNNENKIRRQEDLFVYPNNRKTPIVTEFHYEDKLLTSIESDVYGRKDRTEYFYDNKRKLFKINEFESGNLVFVLSFKYDTKNNNVEVKRHRISSGMVSFEELNYDRKGRLVTARSISPDHPSDSEEYYQGDYVKNHYDKRGYLTKTEIINPDNIVTHTTFLEYNSRGDVVKRFIIGRNGQEIGQIKAFGYEYDFQGNIVFKKIFENGKLVGKTIFELNYR